MKLQKLIKFIVLFLFILPFVLNQIWYAGEVEWMYWVSSYLCYSEILVLGLLLTIIPKKTRNWMNDKNDLQERSLFMKIASAVFGIVLVVIGIFTLTMITGRLLQECKPLLSCF